MKIIECVQGSGEWFQARSGIPTASAFSKIITNTGKPSTQAPGYMNALLAEYFIGEPVDADASGFMQRGKLLEDGAREWYRWDRGVEVREVGFCVRDDGMAGCSPDGFVDPDGGVEIKCFTAANHIGCLLGGLQNDYVPQTQGCMYITGRKWIDLVAYNPSFNLEKAVLRVERDEAYIGLMHRLISTFVEQMLRARKLLIARGCKPAGRILIPAHIATDPKPF